MTTSTALVLIVIIFIIFKIYLIQWSAKYNVCILTFLEEPDSVSTQKRARK